MRTSMIAAAVAVTATAVAAVPASAGEFRYFDCPNPAKVQNIGMVVTDPTWSATKPTGSFTAGEGCGYLDTTLGGTGPETIYDGVFGGNYGGGFEAINVELHDLVLTQASISGAIPFNVRLTVDGDEVFGPEGREVEATPIPSETGLSQSVRFGITGLNYPALSDGGERRVVITIDQSYLDTAAAWVFDASEVPAHAEFIEDVDLQKPAKPTVK